MKYEVKGDSLPVLCVQLDPGEEIICQSGAMSWMDPGIEMKTEADWVRYSAEWFPARACSPTAT